MAFFTLIAISQPIQKKFPLELTEAKPKMSPINHISKNVMEIRISLTEAEILKLKLMLKLKNFLLINLNNLTY
jgi:hypothetical protein